MSKFLVALFSLLALTATRTVYAAESDWNGVFQDPVLNSVMYVCASNLATTNAYGTQAGWYAQATVGWTMYMRGNIVGNVWSGNYYMAGKGARRGTFEYTLTSDSSGEYFTVTSFTDSQGGNVPLTFPGSFQKTNGDTPEKQFCFETDLSYLGASHDFTGTYLNERGTFWNIDDKSQAAQDPYSLSSYNYVWNDGTPSNGSTNGPFGDSFENHQVQSGIWYDGGNSGWEGIEIRVAKDANSWYYMWWFLSNMNSYDYSTFNKDSNAGYSYNYRVGSSTYIDSSAYQCNQFDLAYEEALCNQRTSDTQYVGTSTTLCDQTDTKSLTSGALAFTVCNTLLAIYIVWKSRSKKGTPMAGSSASNL
jgi:hypothetical protein